LKVIGILLISSSFTFAQISPGELTDAHSKLEGLSNCTKCHEIGEKVLNSKCLDCHSEIKSLINSESGYHSSSDVKGKQCGKCHPEHFGRKFKIVHFDPDEFDHNKTGYTLTGSHLKAKCIECHQVKNIIDSEIRQRKGTYLGLNSYCFSCHEDYHQKTLGDNCGKCHGMEKFKPASKFNHEKTKFKLTGKHSEVECLKCHPITQKNGKEFQKFAGLNFTNCSPCHKDVHSGKFGSNCSNCHMTTGFKIINRKNFNHSNTNFPLIGKHRYVDCNKCHKTDLKTKQKYNKCTDCHSDYHNKQFIVDNQIQNCSDCHDEYGFERSQFSMNQHNQSKFKLTGAHLAIPCQNCHFQTGKWVFRDIGLRCIDCHKNVHEDEIQEKYLGNNVCTNCHTTESWSTILFEHKLTGFELSGKHKEQTCKNCHQQGENVVELHWIFKSIKSNCEYCHNDVHAGQFKEGEFSDCTRCHTFDNWKPDKFDHEKTKFSLKGAHQKLDCIKCHPVINQGNKQFVKYRLEDFKCSACHS
jgi:nitrate/TMAO reductase-like tetraheme cytochrome c subunit